MSKEDNKRTPIIPEETWMIQEARTIGLTFLHTKTEDCGQNEVLYVFIHRFNIVKIKFNVDHKNGIFYAGHVEQIGHTHYKAGEFAFDARPKAGLVFAIQDERETIDIFFAVLNKKLLDPDPNNVF